MKVSFLMLMFLATIGCTSERDFGPGTKMNSEVVQLRLTEELDKAGIPYEIDEDLFIRYNGKYKVVVESLIAHLLTEQVRKEQRIYGFEFTEDVNIDAFLAYLHKSNVDIEKIKYNEQDNHVSWPKDIDEEMKAHVIDFIEQHEIWKSTKQ